MCGATTIADSGYFTLNQTECVSDTGVSYQHIYIPKDMQVTLSTDGGTGDFTIYASATGWANSSNFDFVSSNSNGTQHTMTLDLTAGQLFFSLDGDFQEVSVLVATDPANIDSGTDTDTGTDTGNQIPDDGFPTDASRFIGLNGTALVERIALTHPQNVSPIYNISGPDATQVYSESNMITIANAIAERAPSYTGVDDSGLESLLYFFRGAYFIQFSHPEDIPEYSVALTNAIKPALRSLFDNGNAWVATDENGPVLREALTTVDSTYLGAVFNDVTMRVLNEYNADWKASREMNAAANAIFTTLFRSQWDDDMKAIFAQDDSILDALNNFQSSNRDLLGTDAEYVLLNAVREMSRLYHVDALFDRVKVLVRDVINSTSKDNETKTIWIAAAGMADYYDRADCGYYGICGFAFNLERETLSFNYKCSDTLKIRAQHMYNDQAAWICDVLGQQETDFHNKLATSYNPVADDNNQSLELVIFNSSEDYQAYAGLFFGIDTNNGGMYLEGAPINQKNQARFIAYEAEWMRPEFHVWNLQHEYVHYLDARFNLYGDFALGMTVDTVWWTEGLGEYISQGDGNSFAISMGQSQEFALSTIFKNNYNSGQDRIYRWGYLAVRFMFERHRTDVNTILNYIRNGQYEQYQTFINGIGTRYDSEFADWLINGVELGQSNIVEFGPNDQDSTASGQAGNWAGDPVTISTDFSPCVVGDEANKYNPDNNTLSLNQTVECISSTGGNASFFIRNTDSAATRFEIRTTGGWGNADIMYKADGWPTAQDNDGYANGDGNWDSITVE